MSAASTAYEEARMLLDMQVLKDRKIIGMTTSGAARMRKMLQTLAPPIGKQKNIFKWIYLNEIDSKSFTAHIHRPVMLVFDFE